MAGGTLDFEIEFLWSVSYQKWLCEEAALWNESWEEERVHDVSVLSSIGNDRMSETAV